MVVDFSSGELDNWFAEFALKLIILISTLNIVLQSEVDKGFADFTMFELGN